MKHIITAIAILLAFTVNAQVNYYNTTTNGTYSSAIGLNNEADGDNAFVGGINSKAQGQTSFAFGNSAETHATNAFALGLSTKSNGVASFTIGKYITANGTDSYVIGKGMTSSYRLTNDIPNSLMIGMNATKPTLFISPTYGLDKTGKVAIGNMTDPQAKLHIKADETEDASLLLEATGSNMSKIEFGTAGNNIQALNTGNMEFNTASSFFFNGANVGLGYVTDPQANLHIKANENEDARLLLEPGGIDNSAKLLFADEGNYISSKPGDGTLEFNTSETFYFKDNNVGIHYKNSLAPLQIGADWTFNLPIRAGRTIAYNAYYLIEDPHPLRIKKGESSQIKFTDDGSILLETAILAGPETTIEYDNALWIKEGKVGVKKEPSYELDVEGTTRTTHLSAETGHITEFTTEEISCAEATVGVLNAGDLHIDGTFYCNNLFPDGIINLAYEELYITTKLTCAELEISASKWYDEVFKEDYNLPSINEVEDFIAKNHHLPSIPSEAEVMENGIDVAEMNALLLKKIEEMTLYIIEIKKDTDNMKREIENLQEERKVSK